MIAAAEQRAPTSAALSSEMPPIATTSGQDAPARPGRAAAREPLETDHGVGPLLARGREDRPDGDVIEAIEGIAGIALNRGAHSAPAARPRSARTCGWRARRAAGRTRLRQPANRGHREYRPGRRARRRSGRGSGDPPCRCANSGTPARAARGWIARRARASGPPRPACHAAGWPRGARRGRPRRRPRDRARGARGESVSTMAYRPRMTTLRAVGERPGAPGSQARWLR